MRVLNFSYTWVGILPEREEFLLMVYGLVVRSKIFKAEANPSASHTSQRATLVPWRIWAEMIRKVYEVDPLRCL